MQGYDLDDTLAKVEWERASQRGLANVYLSAKVLYVPDDLFVVITARQRNTPAEASATREWLFETQPNWNNSIVWVGGTEEQVIAQKARAINNLKLTDFTDNNEDILAALAPLVSARLWLIKDGVRTPYIVAE